MSTSVVWFELPAAETRRAREFYGRLFGWKFEPFGDEDYHITYEAGGAIYGAPGEKGLLAYFGVDDIDAAIARVRDARRRGRQQARHAWCRPVRALRRQRGQPVRALPAGPLGVSPEHVARYESPEDVEEGHECSHATPEVAARDDVFAADSSPRHERRRPPRARPSTARVGVRVRPLPAVPNLTPRPDRPPLSPTGHSV